MLPDAKPLAPVQMPSADAAPDPVRLATNTSNPDPTELQTASGRLSAKLRSKEATSVIEIHLPAVAGYKLMKKLGEGTYGAVYLAENEKTGAEVAIKFFAHGIGGQWQLLQAEVSQLAKLTADPGIVQLLDVRADATPPYYVMAYAPGGSLAGRLEKGQPLPLVEALVILRQVAEALAYVHAKGVRHCDLKPGNVLLDAIGRAWLADFGQAHLSTDASPTLGTFFYMAPEQANLDKQIPDTRWDVYGLGAIAYAMLTGKPPREDPVLRDELARTVELPHRLRRYREAIHRQPRPIAHRRVRGMDRALAEIIDRCLDLDPARRYRDAGAVLDALDRRKQARRRRPILIFGAGVTALMVLMMATGILSVFTHFKNDIRNVVAEHFKERDQKEAQRIAAAIGGQMHRRIQFIEGKTKTDRGPNPLDTKRLVAALLEPEREDKLFKILDEAHEKADGDFHHFWLADTEGRILSVYPWPPNGPKPGSRDHRDWFSGDGDKGPRPQQQPEPYPPIQSTHVSQPFWSDDLKTSMIAISTPIRDDNGKLLGVLGGSVKLTTVREWYAALETEDSFPVIVNERGQYLLHRKENDGNADWLTPLQEGHVLLGLKEDDDIFKAIQRGESNSRKRYDDRTRHFDPLDKQDYQTSYATVRGVGVRWGVLVERNEDSIERTANSRIGNMSSFLIWIALIGVVILGVLIPGLWLWLVRRLRRGEQVAHG